MSNQHYWQQASPQPPYQQQQQQQPQQQPAYGYSPHQQQYPGQVSGPAPTSGYAPPASYRGGAAAGYPHAQQYYGTGAPAPPAPAAAPQYGMSTTNPAPGSYQYSAAPPPSSYAAQPGYGGASSYPAGTPHSAYQGNTHNAFPQQQQQQQQQPPPPQFNPVPPPPQAGPPIYLGTRLAGDPLQPHVPIPLSLPGYDPAGDVEIIRKATKGFGTDENALNRVICLRTADQLQVLAQAYKSRHGKDLVELIKKETSGYYEQTLCLLLLGPLEGDVTLLHEAIAGAGTKETMVTEILVGRHPNELILLRAAYERRYHQSMDKRVLDDLSFKTKDAFAIVLQGRWQDGGYVQQDLLERDLQDLLPAFRLGFTNEMLISSIIFSRSPVYLQTLVTAFKQRNGRSLTNQIKQHFSGHLQDALLFAVEGGKRDGLGIWRDAKRLEAAMKGAGTADVLLIARLVRAHWDRNRFEQVKLAYQQKYKKALASRVQGETSGHYRDCLLTIVKGA